MKLVFYYLAIAFAIIKLNFDVYHGDDIKQLKNGERNRQGAFAVQQKGSELMVIENSKTWYLAELQFGQNKNTVGVLIDTGSSDLWLHAHDVFCARKSRYYSYKKRDPENVNAKERDIQNKATSYYSTATTSVNWSSLMSKATSTDTCTEHGSFNTAESGSYHANDSAPQFEIYYYDGTFARGTWGYDSVFFGDTEVKDLSFAVADFTDSEMGVFGIGLPSLEMTYEYRGSSGYQYENFPMKLKSQGLIEKNVYSLYLDKMSADSGTVLFGAVDHAKYEGQLQTVPITGTSNYYTTENSSAVRTQIIFSGATFLSNDQTITISEGYKYNAILQSSSSLTYMPLSLLFAFAGALKLNYSTYYQGYQIPCTNDADIKIEFDFNGATIKVPLMDLMIPTTNGECMLGILSSDLFLVGNNILRSGYFVFDLDDEEVSIAQVEYTDEEDIEVISSSVPSAVRIDQYSSTDTSIDTESVSSPSPTETIFATYASGTYSVDGEYFTEIWGLTRTTRGTSTTSTRTPGSSTTTGTRDTRTTPSTRRSSTSTRTRRSSSTTSTRDPRRTAGMKGSGDKSCIGSITSLVSLVLSIIFL